jgi:membrane protein implicated in regulation of membrane protease activity
VIEYFNDHMSAFWFTVGFTLLVIEAVVVQGLTSGVVLFAGIGAMITGGLFLIEVFPQSWLVGIAAFGLSSGLSAALLWKPLLRFQGVGRTRKDNSSDLIGLTFRLDTDVTRAEPGRTRYSGIEWRVELAEDAGVERVAAGQRVRVTSVDVGVFRIRPADSGRGR